MSDLSRRRVLQSLAALGVGGGVFQRALVAQTQAASGGVTAEMIQQAEWIAGIQLNEADRKALVGRMNQLQQNLKELRAQPLTNDVPPALVFRPAPWLPAEVALPATPSRPLLSRDGNAKRPATADELAFLPICALAALLRSKQVSSVELTRLYIERLKKYDPSLKCVVTLTEELALRQAASADQEIAVGKYRGPLHGIPWGAKDLIAYPGYKTTWGAAPFKDQALETKATVAQKLEDAGAVLVAKLTLGALAMGDQWFGGMTRNPWNQKQGSSGSSAGSVCATVAGLIGFGLGSETLGSIVTPSSRCGATGLRPTFGRVSRHGCMALSWSMDKIGPICRSVEDCALVFNAIQGLDPQDPSTVERTFAWPPRRNLKSLRVGYVEGQANSGERPELKVLRELGVQLVPFKLPNRPALRALLLILNVEAATAFDELTRKGVTEGLNAWPQTFREGEFVPAVEYLRANRLRTLLMREMEQAIAGVDLYVGGGFNELLITNLTGHPTVVMPDGFRDVNGVKSPRAITFTGRLYGESDLLAVADAYQKATGHHLQHPPLDKLTPLEEPKTKGS